LTAAGGRLKYRAPVGAVDEELKAEVLAHKGELIALILVACPTCHRPTDGKRRCWHCCDRACEGCGRQTGSAFIANCWPCQHAMEQAGTN
jgi:hypothetical protein